MGAPLWLFDYTAAVLVQVWLASLGSSSWFLHKQKATLRKSSWLIQFPRYPWLEGVRGSREVHRELTGKLNMTAPEEGMAPLKGGGFLDSSTVITVVTPPPPPPIVCPKSHRSMTHKYNRTPTGQYPYLLHSWTCLIACSPQALPSLNLDGYWLTCEAWGDRWECHTGILTCTMSNFLAGKHAEIFLPYHFLLPWRFPCVLWWETGFSSVS